MAGMLGMAALSAGMMYESQAANTINTVAQVQTSTANKMLESIGSSTTNTNEQIARVTDKATKGGG